MTRHTGAAMAAATLILVPAIAAAAPLTVIVEDLEARGGQLYITVTDEAQYATMGQEQTDGVIAEAVEDGTMTFSFDVPPGEYAVSAWHDDNGDGQFNFGPMGPEDGWGVSGTRNMTGLTAFSDAKVEVTEEGAETTFPIIYGR